MNEQTEAGDDHEGRHLAHDLLQSVAIIQAMVAATRASGPDDDRLDANLAIIEGEAQVMAKLCQRQIDGPPVLTPVDLGVVARQVVGRVKALYEGQIEVEVENGNAHCLMGDSVEWERSLLNLVENACRAAGPHGKVSVRCSRSGDFGHLAVGDSGPGFGEAPAGRSSLGMVAVSRLVDKHSGHLELRRSALGGAQVTIVVPCRG